MKQYQLKFLFSLLIGFLVCGQIYSQKQNIKNDSFWKTVDGEYIYSQGGGIFTFKDKTGKEKYYWYGVNYEQAEKYAKDYSETQAGNTFRSVTCYSSDDLVNWKFEADVLTADEVFGSGNTRRWSWLGRMGVAYVKEANQYVLAIQYGSQVLFAKCDSPTGQFKKHHSKNMTEWIGTSNTGDQTVFTDYDTGKSYLVYSNGRGRNRIFISEIGLINDSITLINYKEVYKGAGREGNCMFKYKGKYYLAASNLYGWDSSLAYYLVADDIWGPYLPTNDMLVMKGCEEDYAHITQTGFFYTIRTGKKETVIYCGDRWADFAGNGLGYNQWCPLSFEGATPYFNSLNSWNLDAKTGNWSVASDNNYVKNPSFEADRKDMPSPVKPVQTFLMGWETTVIEGNKISLDSLTSPKLNYKNSKEDRGFVIGERSLRITDKVKFKRDVKQIITSSPYVKFEDGTYNLSVKVRNSDGFNELYVYAETGNQKFVTNIKGKNDSWTIVTLKGIKVKNNKIAIGFYADAKPDAFCLIDDVELIKSK